MGEYRLQHLLLDQKLDDCFIQKKCGICFFNIRKSKDNEKDVCENVSPYILFY